MRLFHTTPLNRFSWRAAGGASLVILLIAPVMGGVLYGTSMWLGRDGTYTDLAIGLGVPGFLLVMGGFITIFVVPFALGLGWVAARNGWAGPLSAVLGAAAIGLIVGLASREPGWWAALPVVFGFYGLLFWLGAVWWEPRLRPGYRAPTGGTGDLANR